MSQMLTHDEVLARGWSESAIKSFLTPCPTLPRRSFGNAAVFDKNHVTKTEQKLKSFNIDWKSK